MKHKLNDIMQNITYDNTEILKLFKNPEVYLKDKDIEFNQGIGISCLKNLLIKSFPNKNINELRNIVEHLMQLDLIDCPSLETNMTLNGVLSSRTTRLGEDILEYIDTM